MSVVPLDVQRRHERRWAARFSHSAETSAAEEPVSTLATGSLVRQKQKQKKNPPGEKSGGSLGCPVPGNAIQIRDVNWILQIS